MAKSKNVMPTIGLPLNAKSKSYRLPPKYVIDDRVDFIGKVVSDYDRRDRVSLIARLTEHDSARASVDEGSEYYAQLSKRIDIILKYIKKLED